nr:hypothetical protein [Halogeometricum sp. CBA1124]
MRELHVEAPAGRCDDVESTLREHDVEFVTASQDDGSTLFFFALPTAAVAPILEALREAGIDEESYTVVTKAEAVETAGYDELRERYANAVGKLSKEELHAKISELQWPFQIYYLGTVLSVLAAAAGLLLDQPALIIGAMIIAPQASSALAAPAGALLSDWSLFVAVSKSRCWDSASPSSARRCSAGSSAGRGSCRRCSRSCRSNSSASASRRRSSRRWAPSSPASSARSGTRPSSRRRSSAS